MGEHQAIPWKRIAAEAAAIVGSILLAFAIDAWWDQQRDKAQLSELLGAVCDDFIQAKNDVAFRLTFHQAKLASIENLMAASVGSAKLDHDTIDRKIADTTWFLSNVPIQTGALDSLIASGLVGSIENQELRRDMTAWPKQIGWLGTQISQEQTLLVSVLMPFFREHGYLPQIAQYWTTFPGQQVAGFSEFPVVPRENYDHSSLLANRKFHNVLVTAWAVQNDAIYAYQKASEWLDTSIELIQLELGATLESKGT